MPDQHGRTNRDEALDLLRQAEANLQTARELVDTARPTKRAKGQAFRLLANVQSTCEVLKIAIDPWT